MSQVLLDFKELLDKVAYHLGIIEHTLLISFCQYFESRYVLGAVSVILVEDRESKLFYPGIVIICAIPHPAFCDEVVGETKIDWTEAVQSILKI